MYFPPQAVAVPVKLVRLLRTLRGHRLKRGAIQRPIGRRASLIRGVFRLPELNRAPRRRGGRWVPPGYMAVDDMVSTAPLSRASLYREIASGKLPATRWRKRVLVPETAYRDWLSTVPAGADS